MAGFGQLDEDRVLYMQEDFWPRERIDLDADSLRITPDCIHFVTYKPFKVRGMNIRGHARTSDYLVCHQSSIWKKDVLLQCHGRGESPWINEVRGTKRVRNKDFSIFFYEHDWYAGNLPSGQTDGAGLEDARSRGPACSRGQDLKTQSQLS